MWACEGERSGPLEASVVAEEGMVVVVVVVDALAGGDEDYCNEGGLGENLATL